MRNDDRGASQPCDKEHQPPHAAAPLSAADPACARQAGPGEVLCRDGAYPRIVTAVRKAVERNAAFGC